MRSNMESKAAATATTLVQSFGVEAMILTGVAVAIAALGPKFGRSAKMGL